ncbi:ABC transporter permease [Nocardioides mesophilus]|uniref:ABC transporter permease n=1 Tax=Nocardioides mesophilus TaxID=433659 RepID=A0A7G9RC97_9ACTN|nr:ABC transporter permease [Nocardioides mesophilus]QNN53222.1 ABC transporter permease [Nocardioides mesophilus]
MTTNTDRQTLPRFNFETTPRIRFSRLVSVELQKAVDTRAGKWLVAAILALTAGIMVLYYAIGEDTDKTFVNFIGFAAGPQSFLLPVLGVLLMTSEWSQRTALVTFALAPSRTQVIGAKVVAAIILGIVAFAGAVIVATVATLAAGRQDGFADVTAPTLLLFLAVQLLGVLQGVAYGLILLNTPAAIVALFVLPTASTILFTGVRSLSDIAPWVDLQTAQSPLVNGDFDITGTQLAQIGVTALIWIVLPFLAGWLRVMRAEIK